MRLIIQVQAIGNQFLQFDFREPFKRSSAATTGPAFMPGSTFTAAPGSPIWTPFATRTTLTTASIVSTFSTGASRRAIAPIASRSTRFPITQLRLSGLMSGVAFRRCSFRLGFGNLERLSQCWLRRRLLSRRGLLCFDCRSFH